MITIQQRLTTQGNSAGPFAYYHYQQACAVQQVPDEEARAKRLKQGAVSLEMIDPGAAAGAARVSTSEQDGGKYVALRWRPDLPGAGERKRRDWVFLFESSGDRDPLLARTQIEIARGLLANAEHDDTFAIVTAGTRTQAWMDQARPATAENVDAALDWLGRTHLIGALDLGHALDAVRPFLKSAQSPTLVHLGSGVAVQGEGREDVLAKQIPDGTRHREPEGSCP